MSFDRRFELPNFDDYDVDTSLCDECPYRFGICWKLSYCIVDDVNQIFAFLFEDFYNNVI